MKIFVSIIKNLRFNNYIFVKVEGVQFGWTIARRAGQTR